ncbi:hypothetical protein, partial [Lentilactobacillus sunkii]|uniref:hypothetical protein n=2 Tax=Lentilactobacillus sunkii TaxID=481719 RepID=UPI000B2D4935
ENAVTVHHLRQDEQGKPTNATVTSDTSLPGRVGQILSVDLNKQPQKVNGYTIVPNQVVPSVKVEQNSHKVVNVYYTGDAVKDAVTVHYLRQDEQGKPTTTKILDDKQLNSNVGEKVTVNPSDAPQEANGYTIVPKQPVKSVDVHLNTHEDVNIYYTGDKNSNINVHLIDTNVNGTKFKVQVPAGHTGEVLNLNDNSKVQIPDGYHRSNKSEIPTGKSQSDNPVYSTVKQDVHVYVTGNAIGENDKNALTVDHYLVDEKGQPTSTTIGTPVKIGGHVGETLQVDPMSKDNQITGYTVTNKEKVTRTLGTKPVDPVKLYYQANGLSNITVHYLDINNDDKQVGDSVNPEGHTGEILNLDKTSTQIHVPEGYHFATNDELKEYQKTQVRELTWGTQDQNANVYVSGNTIDGNSANALTVDHYLVDEKGQPTSTTIGTPVKIGGRVGETVQVNPMSKDNQIAGYTVTSKEKVTRTLGTKPVDPVNLYYTGNAVENAVTVHHLRQDEQGKPTNTTVTSDTSLPGTVGQTLAVDLSKEPQKVNGYTIVPNQVVKPVKVGLNIHEDVNIYYTGDEASNINVHLIDTHHNGTKFNPETPQGHTGEVLNLNDNSKVQIPEGYHRSDKSEIPAGESQSPNPTYTTSEQNVHVYVTGNNIDDTDANTLTVNHYIQDDQGQKTTKVIGTVAKMGGYVGKQVTVDPQEVPNVIPGYTPV